jgi:hypothetical protein
VGVQVGTGGAGATALAVTSAEFFFLQLTLTARCFMTSQQKAPAAGCFCSWNVSQDAGTTQLALPAQSAVTTAMLWLLLQVVLGWKPAEQLPVGEPNEAKSIDEITSPAGQPMFAS